MKAQTAGPPGHPALRCRVRPGGRGRRAPQLCCQSCCKTKNRRPSGRLLSPSEGHVHLLRRSSTQVSPRGVGPGHLQPQRLAPVGSHLPPGCLCCFILTTGELRVTTIAWPYPRPSLTLTHSRGHTFQIPSVSLACFVFSPPQARSFPYLQPLLIEGLVAWGRGSPRGREMGALPGATQAHPHIRGAAHRPGPTGPTRGHAGWSREHTEGAPGLSGAHPVAVEVSAAMPAAVVAGQRGCIRSRPHLPRVSRWPRGLGEGRRFGHVVNSDLLMKRHFCSQTKRRAASWAGSRGSDPGCQGLPLKC